MCIHAWGACSMPIAPHSSTPTVSCTVPTLSEKSSYASRKSSPLAESRYPIVVSQKASEAMSFATLAPISTEQSALSCSRMMSEISTMPLSSKSMPLIAERHLTPGAAAACARGRERAARA